LGEHIGTVEILGINVTLLRRLAFAATLSDEISWNVVLEPYV
jgi:hypothetical protein